MIATAFYEVPDYLRMTNRYFEMTERSLASWIVLVVTVLLSKVAFFLGTPKGC
jgi:hypothetical protein